MTRNDKILLTFCFILGGFIVAILDIAHETHETWQKQVRAEDLKKLGKFIRE